MSARNFYIMQSAVAPLQSEQPCYTPLTNHATDVHTVALVMAYDYAALEAECKRLREALEFYARGDHLMLADPDAWDTCSGEAENWLHDDEGTASVEDGSLAKAALAASTGQEGE